MAEAVEVSGRVVTADGKPVKDVQLVLRPKGEGHPAECPLGTDGRFSVKAVPGEFMFCFQPLEGAKTDRAKRSGFAAVPAKYQDVSVENTVNLNPGNSNEIRLQ